MEEKIIVREDKAMIGSFAVVVLIAWGFFGFLTLLGVLSGEDFWFFFWGDMIALGWMFPVLAASLLCYLLRKLELGYRGCSYRTMFGCRRNFMPEDVGTVRTIPTVWGHTNLVLLGRDGKKILKIETNMINSEKVIPFFETYNASAVWTENGWEHPEPVLINTYERELVVKPNGVSVGIDIFILLIYMPFMWIGYRAWTEEPSDFMHFLVLGMLALAVVLVWYLIKEVRAYRILRLVLTPDICTYTDERGIVKQFGFDEIKEVGIKRFGSGKGAGNKMEIRLSDEETVIRIPCDYTMSHVMEIIPFVEYHREKRYGQGQPGERSS